ncbi:MAG: chromosomal replication initiator protein DnaA [Candidatus Melainabacteria bacterium]
MPTSLPLAGSPLTESGAEGERKPMAHSLSGTLAGRSRQPAAGAAPAEWDALWRQLRDTLKPDIGGPGYETWLAPLRATGLSGDQLEITAPSAFHRDWVMKHYKPALENVAPGVTGRPLTITVTVGDPAPQPEAATQERSPVARPAVAAPSSGANQPLAGTQPAELPWRPWTPRSNAGNLNPRYTFDHFVVGEQSRFCFAAAMAVAESPACQYNPFFIHGGVGLGKTHLIQAIGHFVLQHHPDLVVRYVTAEQFTNDLIHTLGAKQGMTAFQNRYRHIDVLIIDDVQFLEGKTRTQEEVFHTFNTLHGAGKQIILSSDRPPSHLSRLEDRLRSRFEWGLIADIQPPDFETRMAILQRKAARDYPADGPHGAVHIPGDVMATVAELRPQNIRELEGALNKVVAYALLTKSPMDVATTKNLLGATVDPARLSKETIVETVARYYHLQASDLKSQLRSKDVSHARQVAIYLVRELTEASFPKIGELLGGRKHTTILYAYEKLKALLDNHPVLVQQIREIRLQLQQTAR